VNSDTNNSTTLDYCINKAIPDGSNLYYATLFEQTKNKNIIIGLHAFLYELTDIVQECSDPGIARIKLNWWLEETERLFEHQPRHPVTRQLKECLSLDQNLKSSFNSIIENFDQFLFIDQIDTLDSLLALYDSTSGEIWHQCGIQLQTAESEPLTCLRDMGSVYQFIRCLQEPNTYITETRCIIPGEYINRDELFKLRLASPDNAINQADIFSPLLLDLKTILENIYNNLRANDKTLFQHGLILNRLALKTCDEILNDGCRLLNTNISLTPLRKLWLAWWTHFKP
jgi:15-cis-phytoene synthase